MTVRPLTDSRMLDQLADFFPDLCTIQLSTPTQGDSGYLTDVWSDFAGHVDLPCRKSPAGGSEPRRPNMTYAIGTQIITLRDYYDTITANMQAKVNGISYNIIAPPEYDGQKEMTRLTVELVT